MLTGTAGVSGVLKLSQNGDGPTKIVGSITGLAPGKHGLHVHEFGDTTNGCMSTGPHFNPNNMDHGAPTDKIRHAGDLGNVEATAGGCDFTIEDMQIPLSGANSIIGRAFVIHELEDDLGRGDSSEIGTQGESRRDVDAFRRDRARARERERLTERRFPIFSSPSKGKTSKTTGNAGARLACGIVGKVKTIARALFFSFLSSKRPRIVETRRDSPKTSTRVRRAGSVNPIRPRRVSTLDTFSARRIDRGTPRVINYTDTPLCVRNRRRRGVLSPFVS